MKKPWGKARKVPRGKLCRRIRQRKHREPGEAKPLCLFYGIVPRGIPKNHTTHDFVDDSLPKIRLQERQVWARPRKYGHRHTPQKDQQKWPSKRKTEGYPR